MKKLAVVFAIVLGLALTGCDAGGAPIPKPSTYTDPMKAQINAATECTELSQIILEANSLSASDVPEMKAAISPLTSSSSKEVSDMAQLLLDTINQDTPSTERQLEVFDAYKPFCLEAMDKTAN